MSIAQSYKLNEAIVKFLKKTKDKRDTLLILHKIKSYKPLFQSRQFNQLSNCKLTCKLQSLLSIKCFCFCLIL